MRITISGPPGSGKTTVCKLLAERLHCDCLISGTVFREMAKKQGLSLSEFGALAESELGVTMKVDYYPSNEDLIIKLAAGAGNSGFDIVVPTGPYIPQMVEKGLIQKFYSKVFKRV